MDAFSTDAPLLSWALIFHKPEPMVLALGIGVYLILYIVKRRFDAGDQKRVSQVVSKLVAYQRSGTIKTRSMVITIDPRISAIDLVPTENCVSKPLQPFGRAKS